MNLSFKRDEELNSNLMKCIKIKPGVIRFDQEPGGLKRVNILRLESNGQTYNCITAVTALKDRSDVTADTDKDILDVAKTFYSGLYKSTTVSNADMDLAFDSLIPENVLTTELQEKCEGLKPN